VLAKDIGERLRELCRQICSDMSVEILSRVVAVDHVHVLVSVPPQVSVIVIQVLNHPVIPEILYRESNGRSSIQAFEDDD